MNQIEVNLQAHRTSYKPGEWIEGNASWLLDAPPRDVEIRLIWFTRGKGTTDANIVEASSIATTNSMGDAPFRFRLPEAPFSFSGTLISLVWAIEAIATPSKETARIEFMLSPTGEEIILPRIEKPMSEISQRFEQRKREYQMRKSNENNPFN